MRLYESNANFPCGPNMFRQTVDRIPYCVKVPSLAMPCRPAHPILYPSHG